MRIHWINLCDSISMTDIFMLCILAIAGFVALSIIAKIPLIMHSFTSRWNASKKLTLMQRLVYHGVSQFAKYWNGYTINYHENKELPKKALLVGYHSRSTVDLVYFVAQLQLRVIISHIVFQLPIFKSVIRELGGIPSAKPYNRGKEEFIDALVHGESPLMVLPGGVFEFSKSYLERYQIKWNENPGFARVLVDEVYPNHKDVCVVPFHTKNCEEIYWQLPSLYSYLGQTIRDWAKRMHDGEVWLAPIFITLVNPSIGFMLIPRPIKVETFLGEPMYIKEGETSSEFGERVRLALQMLVNKVEERPVASHRISIVNVFKIALYVVLSLGQNLAIVLLSIFFAWTVVPLGVIAHYTVSYMRPVNKLKSN